jgi:D-threo-aldose 1-dehydrogenase
MVGGVNRFGDLGAPRIGLGTAPLGGLFRAVDDDVAVATVHAAIDAGWTLIDTAPLYGHGLAERRLGRALATTTRPRNEIVVSTKVGRVLEPGNDPTTIFRDVPPVMPVFDFSADGVRRSLDESFVRLGLDRIDVALVHDPDDHEADAIDGAFPALRRARDEGLVGAIGCGMNQVAMLERFVERSDDIGLDMVLVAGRWTLLDRSAAALLDRCAERGVAVVCGGVFNSGVLADPTAPDATFDYTAASSERTITARSFAATCRAHGISLAAAAIQFPLRHPAVHAVVVGARSPGEVAADAAAGAAPIPDVLWAALDVDHLGRDPRRTG